jgi:hypothetical protein
MSGVWPFRPSRAFYEADGVLRLRPWVPSGRDFRAVPTPQPLLPRSEPSDGPPRFLMLDGDWVER